MTTKVYRLVRTSNSFLFVVFLAAFRVQHIVADEIKASDETHKSKSHGDDSGYSNDDSYGDDHHGYGYHDYHEYDSYGYGHGFHGLHSGFLGSTIFVTTGLTSIVSVSTMAGCRSAGGVCLGVASCYLHHDDDNEHFDAEHGILESVQKGTAIGTCENSLICCGHFTVVKKVEKIHKRRRRRRKYGGYKTLTNQPTR